MAISRIYLGQLLQRLDVTVVIVFLICTFVKAIICIFAVCNGISKIFAFDYYRFIATPVTFLMFSFSFFIYQSTMEMSFWTYNIYPYYSFTFEVIIPLIIFILVEIKNRTMISETL